jgi:hypothetical protein
LLEEQRVLASRVMFERIMAIAEKYVGKEIDEQTKNAIFKIDDQTKKYETICNFIKSNLKQDYEFVKFDMEFVVGLLYPKIDAHVSAQINHLLKAPFNVHHDSMKLSVPMIDVKTFDVNNCLTINDLVGQNKSIDDIRGTSRYSLGDYVRHFEQFCKKLEESDSEGFLEENHNY